MEWHTSLMRVNLADQDIKEEVRRNGTVEVPGFRRIVVAVVSGEKTRDLVELISIVIREICNHYIK